MEKAKSVVLIEDNQDLLQVYTQAVKIAGFSDIEAFDDGSKAWAWLSETVPDLVFLDLHLPGVDGLLILESLKTEHRFANTTVIVITADGTLALEEGVNRAEKVLVKPVKLSELIDLGKEYLATHK